MNIRPLKRLIPLIFLFATSQAVASGGSVQHYAQASRHLSHAVGHSAVGGVKLSAAVSAAPLKLSGAVGVVSSRMGDDLWHASNAQIDGPLRISDEIITVGPAPDRALRGE